MAGLLLLILLVVVPVMYLRSLGPRQLAGGGWCVPDDSDGPVRNVLGFVTVLASIPLMYSLVRYLDPTSVKQPAGWVLIWLVFVCIYAWLIWHFGKKLFEALNAAPGQIEVAHWPLAVGEQVSVTYRRKFHSGVPAGDVHAMLVFYEVSHGHNLEGKHTSKTKREVKRVVLQSGDASYQNKELVGTWHFQVPNQMGDPVDSLIRGFFNDVLLDRHKDKEWWELHVEIPLRGGGKLDSQFKLKLEMIQGRSVFHMGY